VTAGFDELDDADKVKFSEAEVSATLASLDDVIARMSALRTEVEDADGLMRLTLGDDGRLLNLFIDDAVRGSLANLALEKKINSLFEAGNEAMRASRREFWESVKELGGGARDAELQVEPGHGDEPPHM
jgi:hypothetical protein